MTISKQIRMLFRQAGTLPVRVLSGLACAGAMSVCLPSLAMALHDQDLWAYIERGDCLTAWRAITEADDAHGIAFLETSYGAATYAKSICCSPTSELTNRDLDIAIEQIGSATAHGGRSAADNQHWFDDLRRQCSDKRKEIQTARISREVQIGDRREASKSFSEYRGKIIGQCGGGNLSVALVPQEQDSEESWTLVTPRPGAQGDEIVFSPPDRFIEEAVARYVGGAPRTEVCAPFLAVSADEDPLRICTAAKSFAAFLEDSYGIGLPQVWTTLYRYPLESDGFNAHASATVGRIECDGVLGFYDTRRQSVVYRARSGSFGTFQHELAHAFLFWDIPAAPRWFDEGFSGLFENTDERYCGQKNVWREEVLSQAKIRQVGLDEVIKQIRKSLVDFEDGPLGSTIVREYLRGVQDHGDLHGLYDAMRKASFTPRSAPAEPWSVERQPSDDQVTTWREDLDQFNAQPPGRLGCRAE